MNLTVIYRMSDITSTNPSPIYWEDKKKLNILCLESFVEAYREIDPHVVMICDRCPDYYKGLVQSIVPFEMEVEFTSSGIRENAVHQYDYIKNDDIYLFQECDYYYRKGTGKAMIEAARKFDFITPYDHPDAYMKPFKTELALLGGLHWRTVDSTTSTFMARGSKVKEQLDLFKKYGWEDHDRWIDLGTKGYKLWSPIPSIATHMVAEFMAPNIQWEELYGICD